MKAKFWFIPFLLLITILIPCKNTSIASARKKSAVISIYNNLSDSTYDKDLDKVVQKELQKRLEGLYIELDNQPYASLIKKESLSNKDLSDVLTLLQGPQANYFVYLELLPFKKHGINYVAHFDKNMTASVFLWLVDLNQSKTIYRDHFSLVGKDSSPDWYIGNKSVALKALDGIMFKAGEIISAKLPL